jgi:type I restriction enzyme S subunit
MKWPMVELGDVCHLMTGGTPKTTVTEYYVNGTVPWIVSGDIHKQEIFDCEKRITEHAVENSNARYLPRDSVLIALNGQGKTRGTVALLRFDGTTCNQSIVSINPIDKDKLFPDFLFYYLKSQYQNIRNITGDKDRAGLNMPLIRCIEIPLPPLEEQKRIAAILDKADGIRRKRQQAIQLADDFQRSVFLDMFGDPVTNPKGWEECQFEDLTSLVTYGLTVRPQYHEEGIPLISAREIRSGELDFESSPKISRADFDKLSEKGRPQQGDILFSKTGSIGHCAIVRSEVEFAVTQNAARIVPNKEVCLPTFLLAFMRTKYFYDLANREAKGNAVKDLQLGTMKNFKMYLPPISLQKKFSDLYQKSAFLSKREIDSLFLINSNFNSISQKAFAGGL